MIPIHFEKNKNLLNDRLSTGIEISSDIDKKILKALIDDDEISTLKLPVVLGKGKVLAAGNEKKFEFKGDASVSIDGSASGMLRVGIFKTASELIDNLKKIDGIEVDLIDPEEDEVIVLFSMGYSVNANASGKWLFTGGSLEAGIGVSNAQRIAVVKKVKRSDNVRSSIEETLDAFKLPKLIQSSDDLEENTWIIVQSNGSLEGSFGAQVGYDFNWIYETNTPGLSGAVGLQAKLGAQLGIGFSITGQYAAIVSREKLQNNSEAIHLQLIKQKVNGWNFASSLAASLQGDFDDFKVDNFDELVKATLGIHNTQVLETLKKIRDISSSGELNSELNGFGGQLLQKITDTLGVSDFFDVAKNKLITLLDKWESIGENAGATLWKLLDDQVDIDLTELREKFTNIAEGSDEKVQNIIEDLLANVQYQKTDVGKLINAILPSEDLISILVETEKFQELKTKATAISNLLAIEDQIKKFHGIISEELHIDKIKDAVEKNDLTQLGSWLKGILSDSIGKGSGSQVMEKLKEVQSFIVNVKLKSGDIIKKTKEALKKEYGVSIAYNYQREKTGSALIDAYFILKNDQLPAMYQETLVGDYNKLLTESNDQVILKQGTLTHRVKKERSIALSLPYMKRDFKRINDSIASGKFIDEQDGRLFMYDLDAEDTIRKTKRLSQLALDGVYKGKMWGQSTSDENTMRLSYSFKLAKNRFKTSHFEQVTEPFIKRYLSAEFDGSTNDWIEKLDNYIERIDHNGKNNFGITLLNLELRIPSDIGKAWYKVPNDPRQYVLISNAIQQRLREVIPLYFLENEEVFSDPSLEDELYTILLYQSFPPKSEFKIKKNKLKYHWNFRDDEEYAKLINDERTIKNLGKNLGRIKARLTYDPELEHLANKFDTTNINQREEIRRMAANKNEVIYQRMMQLFKIENEIIGSTIEAGVKLSKFLKNSQKETKLAIESFQQFGSVLTESFNRDTGFKLIAKRKDYTRYIGPELFIAVAQALDKSVSVNTQGSLEFIVLKKKSTFNIESYLDGKFPPDEDIIVSQRIVDIS